MGSGTLTIAQEPFEAHLMMKTGEILEATIRPRLAGASIIHLERKDRSGLVTQPVDQIQRIHFKLSGMDQDAILQSYYAGNYQEVLEAMRGRIHPYFAFTDMNANTNELVELFLRALYHTGNHAIVKTAAEEVARHTRQGPVRTTADLYAILSAIKLGEMENIEERMAALPEPDLLDPRAPAVWYAQAQIAIAEDDWDAAYIPLARIITEAPMDTEWIGEALYLTARYHHRRTNLIVANQICQEIMIVAADSTWATQAEARMINLKEEAMELDITLTEFGAFREDDRREEDAAIDYRERQRKLREEAVRQRQEELDEN
jgi:tetratricopeptide (TPR) repeat protein